MPMGALGLDTFNINVGGKDAPRSAQMTNVSQK